MESNVTISLKDYDKLLETKFLYNLLKESGRLVMIEIPGSKKEPAWTIHGEKDIIDMIDRKLSLIKKEYSDNLKRHIDLVEKENKEAIKKIKFEAAKSISEKSIALDNEKKKNPEAKEQAELLLKENNSLKIKTAKLQQQLDSVRSENTEAYKERDRFIKTNNDLISEIGTLKEKIKNLESKQKTK